MKHILYFDKPPVKSGKESVPDGAVNGNGDLGIVFGVYEGGVRVYLSKCDIREGLEDHGKGGAKPLGFIDIPAAAESLQGYRAEQDMDKGELRCVLGEGDGECRFTARVCKTENSVLLEYAGNAGVPVLRATQGETSGEKGSYDKNGCSVIFRRFAGEKHRFETHAAAAMKTAGCGKAYVFVATNHDAASPEEYALQKAESVSEQRFEELKKEHYAAWESFWGSSSFTVSDEELENRWVSSLYLLACCAGSAKFPPGLYGNFITVENPSWKSDYHLNYNYEAPFYAACSSNHPELTDSYAAPLEQFIERGKKLAGAYGCRGVILPVGIDVMGLCSELDKSAKFSFERLFLGQKNNGIHAADIMVFRWNATRDEDYARRHALPYLREALLFFEDWMKLENGRYSVPQDAAHEVPYYRQDFDPKKFKRFINGKNSTLTLGMLRLCLKAAVDMSETLGENEEEREKWRYQLEHLSPFPVCVRHFQKVFRYTEKGQRWNDSNDVGLQHIYPAGCIGLGSEAELLKIARQSFYQKKSCYKDGNAACSYFPMAARLGEVPEVIVQKLRELEKTEHALPNGMFDFGCGGIENCSLFANTLNEMAMQSHEGILRLFPVWDKSLNASFRCLRADGAFLVSSSISGGKIGKTEILAEKGGKLTIENPFTACRITRGGRSEVITEKIFSLATEPGETVIITEET